ncbi:MAG TPA: hypothetical protein PKK63_04235 [Bacillota bacterium]|nr:hypothetical protein [Bacillota bacterium]
MKTARPVIVLAVLALLISMTGCNETWSVDFTEVYDVDDWDVESFGGGPGAHTLYDEGFFLNYYRAIGPYGFSGDFTMTVVFSLDVDEANKVDKAWIGLGDGTGMYTLKHIMLYLNSIGEAGTETLDLTEIYGGDFHSFRSMDYIPAIRRHGLNTYKLSKNGDTIKAYFNGVLLCEYMLQHYDLVYSFPIIYAVQDSPKLLFKSVKFSYSGTYEARP